MPYQYVKALKVHLQNYCGYTDTTFDFSDSNGGVIPFAAFYGPNGIGKTTGMRALQLAANPVAFRSRERDSEMMMRKSIHDVEYMPTVDMMKKATKNPMLIEVDFLTDLGIKKVVIDNLGLVTNELGYDDCPINGWTYFADADNAQNTVKFLLAYEHALKFLTFAEEVYGYRCELGRPVNEQGIKGYTDFVIQKGDIKVHFKSMSAGEKKIATLISDLCQPVNSRGRDIVLVDNVEMHVYYKRHARMIDRLRDVFPEKQIITTTHSSVVIEHIDPAYRFDLELYRPEYKLMEVSPEERQARYEMWMKNEQERSAKSVQGIGSFIQSDALEQIIAKRKAREAEENKPETPPEETKPEGGNDVL